MGDSNDFDDAAPPKMHITPAELSREKIPLAFRDYCAHLLPSLNKCRREHYYLPWHCDLERTAWNKCQYDDYQRRMRVLERRKKFEEEKAARAALDEAD